tara:strand:+ start:329 stop:628 length:300 start_codon:yes stop_codon:yes gene_type:complete
MRQHCLIRPQRFPVLQINISSIQWGDAGLEREIMLFSLFFLVSIIASLKRQTFGYQLRHIIIDKWGEKMDLFGRDYNLIDLKKERLWNYRFSVVENSSE